MLLLGLIFYDGTFSHSKVRAGSHLVSCVVLSLIEDGAGSHISGSFSRFYSFTVAPYWADFLSPNNRLQSTGPKIPYTPTHTCDGISVIILVQKRSQDVTQE